MIKKYYSFLIFLFVLFHASLLQASGLSIFDILKILGKESRVVKIFQNEKEKKDFFIKKVQGLNYPTIDGDLSYNILNEKPEAKTSQGNLPLSQSAYLKGQIALTQLIYDFGKRESIIKLAMIDRSLSDLYLKKELNDLAFKATNLFYQICILKKAIQVYEEEIKTLEEHKKKAQAFYDEGLITRNEVLQTEVEIQNSKQKLIDAKTSLKNAKETLKNLLNTENDINIEDMEFPNNLIDSLQSLENKRAELEIAERLVTLKDIELKQIQSNYYPKLYGAVGLNYEENRYRSEDYNVFASIGLKINLFDGMQTTNEKMAILAEKKEQEEKLNQTKDIVKLDTLVATNELVNAENQVSLSKTAITQAKENLKIIQNKYTEHLVSSFDVIDARLLLSRAELNYYRALYSYKNAIFKKLWAYGKLYEFTGE